MSCVTKPGVTNAFTDLAERHVVAVLLDNFLAAGKPLSAASIADKAGIPVETVTGTLDSLACSGRLVVHSSDGAPGSLARFTVSLGGLELTPALDGETASLFGDDVEEDEDYVEFETAKFYYRGRVTECEDGGHDLDVWKTTDTADWGCAETSNHEGKDAAWAYWHDLKAEAIELDGAAEDPEAGPQEAAS